MSETTLRGLVAEWEQEAAREHALAYKLDQSYRHSYAQVYLLCAHKLRSVLAERKAKEQA